MWTESVKAPEKFWARQAKTELVWFKPFTKVLQWKVPFAKWFLGGKLNVAHNCLDRWLDTPSRTRPRSSGRANRPPTASPGEERTLTYRTASPRGLSFRQRAQAKRIKKGDRVIIYLPMIPEAAIAMLACTRIGAVHSVVFGGFSAQSVADRDQRFRSAHGHHG